MGFIRLNRYGEPDGTTFDPANVIDKIRGAFANVRVLPGDQLSKSADLAAQSAAPEHIVRKLRQNQLEYGPAMAFEVDTSGNQTIRGTARRFDVTFTFPDLLPKEWQQRLINFLNELGSGRIEGSEIEDPTKPLAPTR